MFAKKSASFSKTKILFRCDAANIPEIGTGHLFRCITIARYLKSRFNLKYKDISFLIKTKSDFKIGYDIIKKYKFNIIQIKKTNFKLNSREELEYIVKNPARLLIIDRMGKTNKYFVNKIQNYFNRKIIIDDASKYRKYFDISINPMVHKVSKQFNSYIGFNYLILPVFFFNHIKGKSRNNNIFIFFGGHDQKKLNAKILKILNKIDLNLKIYVSSLIKNQLVGKKFKHKIIFFRPNEYLKKLNLCKISITAGGLSLFDNIVMNKKIICIPQYKHQEENINNMGSKKVVNLIKVESKNFEKKFKKIFINFFNNISQNKDILLEQKKIASIYKIKKTLLLIEKVYAKSKN
tara:strand:+ start:14234 stop:15280 length:1047 start_codon:yes stop_codon:yes gene_type:complete